MPDWYQPDRTWAALGISTREAYAEQHVVAGRFHAGVPADVVRACATASHLLAQAWYHYPLYDEAITKLLFTVELAVKQRCQQLGLAAERVRQQSWQKLSAYLCAREPQKGHLLGSRLDQVRQRRNAEAHPDCYRFGGIAFHRHVLPLLNLLNFLFVDEAVLARAAPTWPSCAPRCPRPASCWACIGGASPWCWAGPSRSWLPTAPTAGGSSGCFTRWPRS